MFEAIFVTFWAVVLAVIYLSWRYESNQIVKLLVKNQKLWNEIKKDLRDDEIDEAYLQFIESLPNTPHGKGYPLE